jgi:hypothetical protein
VDKVLVMEHGRTLESGARVALASDPGSRLAALLRAGLEQIDGISEPQDLQAVLA